MKPTIALFLHQPKCSVQSGNGIMKALEGHYNFKIFTKHEIEKDFFDGVDIVAFPGGLGDSDSFDFLLKNNIHHIYNFVRNGGRYLGICMGAYWADQWYFDIVDDVRVVQYIKRPNADVRRSYATVTPVVWNGKETNMYFYDGCSLIGDETKFKTIARYSNGDPMAIIKGTVGLIGCHPESSQWWYEKPWQYINKHWHNNQHHKLLLEFVNELMEQK